jgi:PAS domain S-box-containing protein
MASRRLCHPEQVLEDREGFLNSLIENIPIAVVVIGNDETVEMYNPAFEYLFDYSQNAVLGRPLMSLLTTAEIRAEVEPAIKSVREGGRVHEITRRSRSE